MNTFRALVVRCPENKVTYEVEDVQEDMLSEGDVLIKVAYSSVNYKDMLATQTKGGVIRSYPMIPGIDMSGEVVACGSGAFSIGQQVLVTGYQMGMSHTGGFSEYVRVPSEWVIPLPKGFSSRDAMIMGTAGLTAALSIEALQKHGLDPKKQQNILVTGASGGVGSLALQMLSKIGYRNITALVRKPYQVEVVEKLGATETILLDNFEFNNKPLAKQQFHFILDTVGGELLSNLLPFVHYQGSASLCGNAGGIKLATTVLPFILRGINLLGIDSVNITREERLFMWEKLSGEWNVCERAHVQTITLEELSDTIRALKDGKHIGRTILKF